MSDKNRTHPDSRRKGIIMRFTEEMIAEDERRWHARDVITELGYCGKYMVDRRKIRNDDIRFYAYLMRQAHEILKMNEEISMKKIEVYRMRWVEVYDYDQDGNLRVIGYTCSNCN